MAVADARKDDLQRLRSGSSRWRSDFGRDLALIVLAGCQPNRPRSCRAPRCCHPAESPYRSSRISEIIPIVAQSTSRLRRISRKVVISVQVCSVSLALP